MLVPQEIPLLISANPNLTNAQIRNNNSEVLVQLTQPLMIPKNAQNITLSLESATIWNDNPNVITGYNDSIKINGIVYILPQGLYDITLLNFQINQFLISAGITQNSVVFGANLVSGKVTLTLFNATIPMVVDIQTLSLLTGLVASPYSSPANVSTTFEATQDATFNRTNFYLIHCNIIPDGLLYNNQYSSILVDVPIDVQPLRQIIYNPQNPCRLSCNLAGSIITSVKVWITDDSNRSITTNEIWSVRMSLSYLLPQLIIDANGKPIN